MARLALLLESYPNQVRLEPETALIIMTSSVTVHSWGTCMEQLCIFTGQCCVLTEESLNFGVSTLEEIRLRKALKASMKRAGYPIQNADTPANGEKENIQSFFRPALYEARDGKNHESVRLSGFQKVGYPDLSSFQILLIY